MHLKSNRTSFPVPMIFLSLLCFVLVLVVMHFYPESRSRNIHNRFDLNAEANIPTWFSTVLLFSVSLCSLGIYILRKNTPQPRIFWLMFSGVYCFLSLDEAARLHEIIDVATSIKWVFVYAPVAGIFFIICAYHLIKNENKTLRQWILGGLVVYATGGLFSEFIGYSFYPLSPLLQQAEFVIEEALEMIGTLIVLRGCLHELNRLWICDQQTQDVDTV